MRTEKFRHSPFALLLTALLLLTIVLAAAPAAYGEETAAPAAEMKTVEAATVDEFLKAIAPDTVITLTGRS